MGRNKPDYTKEENFELLLHALNTREPKGSLEAIKLLREIHSPAYSEIPSYTKNSFVRKVLRYVTNYTLTHTEEEVNQLSIQAGFASMYEGHPVSIREYEKDTREDIMLDHSFLDEVKGNVVSEKKYNKLTGCFE